MAREQGRIFERLTYAEPISQFVGGVDFNTPLSRIQKVYDTAEANGHFVKPVDAHEKDIKDRDERLNYYKSEIQKATEIGDPYKQLKRVRQLGQEYIDEMHQGKIGQIQSNYNSIQAHAKELQDQYDKKIISKDQRDYLYSRSINEYNGVGEKNEFGAYNKYIGRTGARFIYIEPIAEDLAEGWMKGGFKGVDPSNPNKVAEYRLSDDGKFQIKTSKRWEGVSAKEIANGVLPSLKKHQEGKEYLSQYGEMEAYKAGLSGEEASKYSQKIIDDIYNTAVNRVANKYGYGITEYDQEIHNDPYGAAKAGIDAQKIMNPPSEQEVVTNNPNAIPEVDQNYSRDVTLDDFYAYKGLIERPVTKNTSNYLINGKSVSKQDFEKAKENIKEEYKAYRDSPSEDFINNPAVKSIYGDLPKELFNSIKNSYPTMGREDLKKELIKRLDERAQHSKTTKYNYVQLPPKVSDLATEQSFGKVKIDEDGSIKEGAIGTAKQKLIFIDGKAFDFKRAAEYLGLTEGELAVRSRVVGELTGDNVFTPSGQPFVVSDENGVQRDAILGTTSKQADQANLPLYKATTPLFNQRINKVDGININGVPATSTAIDFYIRPDGTIINWPEKDANYFGRTVKLELDRKKGNENDNIRYYQQINGQIREFKNMIELMNNYKNPYSFKGMSPRGYTEVAEEKN